ncbi:MAG: MBL fold metallo-hydrolase, partial [Nitrososphaera sp.]
MAKANEIAPDVYRISIYVPEFNLQFNHFLIKDDESLLFHTGYKRMFPQVRDAVATIIKPSEIRWISFSHFESDECGSLNQWLEVAPSAQAACSVVGALVSVNDFANRPARGMA